jgi:ABC-2 type transport system permease protein
VQIIVDGSDANTATIVMNYASSVMRRNSIGIITERIGRSPMLLKMIGRVGGIEGRSRIWYNPDLKSSNYMVPGVICLVLLLNCVILMAVAFVRERESKTLEQLLATPVKPVELILGKVIPYILISFVNVVSVALIAVFWFRIDIKGSLILLFLLSLLFLISALGIGLLISVISKTQYQALMTAIFILLPSVLLSGFIFPIANMPKVIQYLTLLIPMRYYLIIVRGIFLKGVGIGYLWGEVWPLIVFGVATLYLSTLWFRKRMD